MEKISSYEIKIGERFFLRSRAYKKELLEIKKYKPICNISYIKQKKLKLERIKNPTINNKIKENISICENRIQELSHNIASLKDLLTQAKKEELEDISKDIEYFKKILTRGIR